MQEDQTQRQTTRDRFTRRVWGPLTGPINYEFRDRDKIAEHGVVASPKIVEERFAAFKALCPWEDESNG